MTGVRWRLVTRTYQDGQPQERYVSSLVMSEQEAADTLKAERALHTLAGWRVWGDDTRLVCCRGRVARRLEVLAFLPAEDTAA